MLIVAYFNYYGIIEYSNIWYINPIMKLYLATVTHIWTHLHRCVQWYTGQFTDTQNILNTLKWIWFLFNEHFKSKTPYYKNSINLLIKEREQWSKWTIPLGAVLSAPSGLVHLDHGTCPSSLLWSFEKVFLSSVYCVYILEYMLHTVGHFYT